MIEFPVLLLSSTFQLWISFPQTLWIRSLLNHFFHLVKSSSILSGWVPGIGFRWLWRIARTGGDYSQRAESGGLWFFGLFAISSGAQIFSGGLRFQNAKSVSAVLTMLLDCWHIILLILLQLCELLHLALTQLHLAEQRHLPSQPSHGCVWHWKCCKLTTLHEKTNKLFPFFVVIENVLNCMLVHTFFNQG